MGKGYVVWHPVSLPEGYHALPRGQAWHTRPTVRRRCCPRDSAWSGCARLTGCHTTPSVQDHPPGRHWAVGRREALRNLEK
jgi:hypothetical protein